LKTKWDYDQKMANLFLLCGYDRIYAHQIMEQLNIHSDIEVINEGHDFKGLKWKFMITEINPETREISLHNFSILKDQILLNKHNPLLNTKGIELHKIRIESDKNEEVRKKLIFSLQGKAWHMNRFEQDCQK
jgi:hypothetical protein